METKRLIGTIIIILNASGLGLVLYLIGLAMLDRFVAKKTQDTEDEAKAAPDTEEDLMISEEMIPEDSLLEDMDLSDLDDLDLDDLE